MLPLAACLVATAFMPSGTPFLSPAAVRSATPSMRINRGLDRDGVAENFKTGGIAAVAGSIVSAPLEATKLLASKAAAAQWASKAAVAQVTFQSTALALQLVFFGALYRYVVRCDGDEVTKQGAVGSFAMLRALSCTQNTGTTWAPDMYIFQLAAYFGESLLAFAAAAWAIEYATNKGYILPLQALDFEGYEVPGDPFQRRLGQFRDFDGPFNGGRMGRDNFGRENYGPGPGGGNFGYRPDRYGRGGYRGRGPEVPVTPRERASMGRGRLPPPGF